MPVSYDEIITLLLRDAEQKQKEAVKLWEEKQYEQIVSFLGNLQQGDKLVKHDVLKAGYADRFKSITTYTWNHVSNLEKKVSFFSFALSLHVN